MLSGQWDDWHPPIMVALWTLVRPFAAGTAPMLAIQLLLFAAGVAGWAAGLVAAGRPRAAWLVVLLGFAPLTLGWQAVVLKDSQMLGALVAATGLVGWYRLRERPIPPVALVGVILLLSYATLVRSNAAFATGPLAALLVPLRRRWGNWLAVPLLTLVFLAAAPLINHRLLGAAETGVANSLPVYSLAAIAVATPLDAPSPFTAAERSTIARKRCVQDFFWDPLGEPSRCGAEVERVQQLPAATLYPLLAKAIAAHPLVYARHRLGHWNMSERWLVPAGLILAAPPAENEPNEFGLASPGPAAAAFQTGPGAWEAGTPFGWPILWLAAALMAAIPAVRARDAADRLALALAMSALGLEASFLVVSISSDLRYHLWSMLAAGIALVLVAPRIGRRGWIVGAAALGVIVAAGLTARHQLPRAPDSYRAMLDA